MAGKTNDIRNSDTVTIALSGTISTALEVAADGVVPVAIFMPATFTGTAITFQGSLDNVTFQAVTNDAGAAVSVTVAAAKCIGLSLATRDALTGWPYLKLVSGSTEAGARSIIVVSRPIR